MLVCDRTFLGNYDFGLCELPGGGSQEVFWYPGASTVGGHDGVLLEIVSAEVGRWIGTFAFGNVFDRDSSWAIALPDRCSLAIVAKDTAYRVSSHDPSD